MAEFGRETVIAHNDPSPARERVLRVFEQKHAPINIQIALPSLEAIKRAVEMRMGVALLPKRCALTEIARGQLVAVRMPQLRLARQLRLVYRRVGDLSHAADAFLAARRHHHPENDKKQVGRSPSGDVGQPGRGRSHLLEVFEQETRAVPRPLVSASRALAGIVADTMSSPDRTSCATRSTTNSAFGSASARDNRRSTSSGDTVRQGKPSCAELPKKISEYPSPTIARMPQRWMACGACSRDDPHPKFRLTIRIDAPW